VSPRSDELFDRAREGLHSARDLLAAGHSETAVSTAYYAMLYAARAALSERDRHSRTHRGTWAAFHECFVVDGPFDTELFRAAQHAQQQREASDYDAAEIEPAEAQRLVEFAARFLDAVGAML